MLKTTIMLSSFLYLNAGNLDAREWIVGKVPHAPVDSVSADEKKSVEPKKTMTPPKKNQLVTSDIALLDEKIKTFLRVYKKTRQSRIPIVQLPSTLKPLCSETAKKSQLIFLKKGSVLLNCLIEFKQNIIPSFTEKKIGTAKTCLLKMDQKRLTEKTHLDCLEEMSDVLSLNVDLIKKWNDGHENTEQSINSKYR